MGSITYSNADPLHHDFQATPHFQTHLMPITFGMNNSMSKSLEKLRRINDLTINKTAVTLADVANLKKLDLGEVIKYHPITPLANAVATFVTLTLTIVAIAVAIILACRIALAKAKKREERHRLEQLETTEAADDHNKGYPGTPPTTIVQEPMVQPQKVAMLAADTQTSPSPPPLYPANFSAGLSAV